MIPHYNYDLGYISFGGWFEPAAVSAIVSLNYATNVMLLDASNYQRYISGLNYSYHGGHVTSSPVNLPIPTPGHWHLVVDNGGDDMYGIDCQVHTKNYDMVSYY